MGGTARVDMPGRHLRRKGRREPAVGTADADAAAAGSIGVGTAEKSDLEVGAEGGVAGSAGAGAAVNTGNDLEVSAEVLIPDANCASRSLTFRASCFDNGALSSFLLSRLSSADGGLGNDPGPLFNVLCRSALLIVRRTNGLLRPVSEVMSMSGFTGMVLGEPFETALLGRAVGSSAARGASSESKLDEEDEEELDDLLERAREGARPPGVFPARSYTLR